MNIPSDLRYCPSHEWLRLDGETATVGISDHAQQELTDVVFVELPAVGRTVDAGDRGTLEMGGQGSVLPAVLLCGRGNFALPAGGDS